MFFRDSAELQLAPAGGSPPRDRALGVGVGACLVVTVGSFFAVQPLIDACALGRRAPCRSSLGTACRSSVAMSDTVSDTC